MFTLLIVLPNRKTRSFTSIHLKSLVFGLIAYRGSFKGAEITLWSPDGSLLAYDNAA